MTTAKKQLELKGLKRQLMLQNKALVRVGLKNIESKQDTLDIISENIIKLEAQIKDFN